MALSKSIIFDPTATQLAIAKDVANTKYQGTVDFVYDRRIYLAKTEYISFRLITEGELIHRYPKRMTQFNGQVTKINNMSSVTPLPGSLKTSIVFVIQDGYGAMCKWFVQQISQGDADCKTYYFSNAIRVNELKQAKKTPVILPIAGGSVISGNNPYLLMGDNCEVSDYKTSLNEAATTRFANSTPLWLISFTSSSSPCLPNLNLFAPNVLVMMSCAPASIYSR